MLAALPGISASAGTLQTLDAALHAAFPDAEVRRDVLYPTSEEVEQASESAGLTIEEAPIYRYRAFREGKLLGTAYPDRHRVRTLPEVLLVIVDPEGRAERVTVLAFSEPMEYMPSKPWYDLFSARPLDDELTLNRGIDGVTGATLTARATTQCVRRCLALHHILEARDTP